MIFILILALICKMFLGAFRLYMGNWTDDFLKESEAKDDWRAPGFWLINFIIGEFIPVSALLMSFWYGLSRRSKVIRSRKYSTFEKNRDANQGADKSPMLFDIDEDEDYSNNPFGIATRINFS